MERLGVRPIGDLQQPPCFPDFGGFCADESWTTVADRPQPQQSPAQLRVAQLGGGGLAFRGGQEGVPRNVRQFVTAAGQHGQHDAPQRRCGKCAAP